MNGLRQHQATLKAELSQWNLDTPVKILAHVVPGGGKSWLPKIVHDRFPRMKIAWFVPRVSLREQAAEAMLKLGVRLWESENVTNPSRGTDGFVATHQGLAADPGLYIDELRRHPYILVIDELHHAKVTRKGESNQLASLIPRLEGRVRLLMTGTLDTNDNTFIQEIQYDEIPEGWRSRPDRSADIVIRYDRKTALEEGAVVPISFHHHDGPVEFIGKNGKVRRKLSDMDGKEDRGGALFTALKTELAVQLLRQGVVHWKAQGDQLVLIGASQYDVRVYHRLMTEMGIETGLAISEEDEAAKAAVKAFRRHEIRVLATCAMCYEGMDAPSTTHEICLTHIRSKPWIEQMLARAWRSHPGKARCWAFVPDDPDMNEVIESIRADEIADVPGLGDPGPGPGPGPRSCTIPISSGHDATRIKYLDEGIVEQQDREKVVAAMEGLGLSPNHPVFVELMKAVAEQGMTDRRPAVVLTESEEAKKLRDGMARRCRDLDRARGVPFGTTGKELYKITGVLFDEATLRELQHVAAICSRHCERFIAR